jgi:hypothetical protein
MPVERREVTDAHTVVEGQAGASGLREYERRRLQRGDRARAKLSALGGLLARVVEEPPSTKGWKQGAEGEALAGARLAKHLQDSAVKLLHDRRIPARSCANIDHLAVGPGGITVIDIKNCHGEVRVESIGGLFSERRTVLTIASRDRTRLITGVETQITTVRAALSAVGQRELEIRGALCFANVYGLPLLRRQTLRGVIVDGPRAAAQLARRPGSPSPATILELWATVGFAFPPA